MELSFAYDSFEVPKHRRSNPSRLQTVAKPSGTQSLWALDAVSILMVKGTQKDVTLATCTYCAEDAPCARNAKMLYCFISLLQLVSDDIR